MRRLWLRLSVVVLGIWAANAASPAHAQNVVYPGESGVVFSDDNADSGPAVLAGASAMILRPYFSSNDAYSSITRVTTAFPSRNDVASDFDFSVSPKVWLGIVNPNGLGVRANYFQFDQSSNPANTTLTAAQAADARVVLPSNFPASPGITFGSPSVLLNGGLGADLITIGNQISIQTFDVEATYLTRHGCFDVNYSVGARYLHLSQDYLGQLRNISAANDAAEFDAVSYGHNFSGAGPLAGLEVHLPITSQLKVYGGARASLLVGNRRSNLFTSQVVRDPNGVIGGDQRSLAGRTGEDDTILSTGELEAGIEYWMPVGHRMRAFGRAAVVDQTYFGAGSPTNQNGDFSLFGGQFTLGLTF